MLTWRQNSSMLRSPSASHSPISLKKFLHRRYMQHDVATDRIFMFLKNTEIKPRICQDAGRESAYNDSHLCRLGLTQEFLVSGSRERFVATVELPVSFIFITVWWKCRRRASPSNDCSYCFTPVFLRGRQTTTAQTYNRNNMHWPARTQLGSGHTSFRR
jgi:hypothetical protein